MERRREAIKEKSKEKGRKREGRMKNFDEFAKNKGGPPANITERRRKQQGRKQETSRKKLLSEQSGMR